MADLEKYPNVILAHDAGWDPTEFDDVDDETFLDTYAESLEDIFHDAEDHRDDRVDEFGNYRYRDDYTVDNCIFHAKGMCTYEAAPHIWNEEPPDLPSRVRDFVFPKARLSKMAAVKPKDPDYERLRPYLGWINLERIQETLRNTSQWFRADSRWPLRRHFKTRFPAANVPRLNEAVATDTFFADTPAADESPGMGEPLCSNSMLAGRAII